MNRAGRTAPFVARFGRARILHALPRVFRRGRQLIARVSACLSPLLGSPALHSATPAPPSTTTTPLLSDSDVLARVEVLSLDERRYLVYLYSRLDNPTLAARLAESILAQTPGDRQTLLVLAAMYSENKDAAALLRTARRFLAAHPDDHQGLYYLGAAHFLAGDFTAAHRVLGDLKRTQFTGRTFPYESDLAAYALAAGDWERARSSYEELLQHDDLLEDYRRDIHRALTGILREHQPRLELGAAQTRLDRASIWRTHAVHGRHLGERHWLDLRYTRDDVTLDAAPGLRAADHHRAELGAHVATTHNPRWRSEAWAGLSGEGAFGGMRLQHVFADQREASLEFAGNVRANDSLALEALDGRQHHVALAANWRLASELVLGARGHLREVHLTHDTLGRGAGVDVNLDRTFRPQSPRITGGYRSTIARFSADEGFPSRAVAPIADPSAGVPVQQAIAANLVSRRINRHGAGTLVTDTLADVWVYRLTAGVDYDFVLSSTGWNAGLGVTYLLRKHIELSLDASYTSSANASNAGSAATLLSCSLRAYF